MADVAIGTKDGYNAGNGIIPIVIANGTDSVALGIVADYSKLILTVTASNGTDTVYEATLTERS